ncbi:tRNA 5-methylaminomethyl-2-thiouridine synthase [Bradyrhizobium jicamae]|uniref:DUF6894 family protein n=1 Tax=Bradyrhizobium jicamae TaxID=280332 RepID=UPI001BA58831|nr:tRNA 5-methylaminomethyl-2-thiouridine synthase [Bradyrhizobium jicamae]MBR0750932.1 tRNA 5-methylaminomethyl-2-thiouridine synthase [Bradyrhizobium jicamae]
MTRYFFHISNGQPFSDPGGEELADDHAAWTEALRTVRDVEATLSLEQAPRWSLEVKRGATPIFRIDVTARKL